MVDLDKLKDEIYALGDTIKSLKSADSVDNDAVGKAVAELLDKKKLYADHNNGIGVDGKPFQTNLTKAEKKAQAKADKGGGPGPAKQVSSHVWVVDMLVISTETGRNVLTQFSPHSYSGVSSQLGQCSKESGEEG